MLVYKALYRKMMDALKDSGMWIDWAEQLKETQPEVAKYLADSANFFEPTVPFLNSSSNALTASV